MSGRLLVPSDISLLEEKYTTGQRRLRLFERIGLMGIMPMLHINYSKNDKHDFRRILSREYGVSGEVTQDNTTMVNILKTRQASIRKRVLRQNYLWGSVGAGTLLISMSLRHYDLKSKCIILPFAAYGLSFIGRWTGDLLTGRWNEYKRDRFLSELPSKQYFIIN